MKGTKGNKEILSLAPSQPADKWKERADIRAAAVEKNEEQTQNAAQSSMNKYTYPSLSLTHVDQVAKDPVVKATSRTEPDQDQLSEKTSGETKNENPK
jgi:crotonobetainyl-CoA:carnitine CoA-transferase CaiB-like acyl-CoA transferase